MGGAFGADEKPGKGVCGVYPHDIASSRVAQVAQYARARQHPLQCVLEPADDA